MAAVCVTAPRGGKLCLASLRRPATGALLKTAHLPTYTQSRSSSSSSSSISTQLNLPHFKAHSKDISLLQTPSNFYTSIKSIISRAQSRIFLSSLYIGKDELELIDSLRSALQSRPSLKLIVLVDALRSTREGPFDPARPEKTNSCASLLASLHRDFPHQVDVRLYRTPGLSPWMERLIGKRLVEGAGLQHMKIYGGDDEVIISGANLSNDYFTNRQDRYVHFKSNPTLSQYLHSLILVTAKFSYGLRALDVASGGGSKTPYHSPYRLEWDHGSQLLLAEHYDGSIAEDGDVEPDIQHTEHSFQLSGGQAIQAHTSRWQQSEQQSPSSPSHDTTITPLIQMGPLNITQETTSMPTLFDSFHQPNSRLDITSGYFSLFPAYKDLVLALPPSVRTRIIAAAPISNGFYGSKGISRHVPPAYTWLEKKFYEQLKAAGKDQHVTISEWVKQGWTYHAKGIWYTPPSHTSPTHTLLGSSNFGSRSALRDLECTLLIETEPTSPLSTQLKQELQALHSHATQPVDDQLFARPDRRVHPGVRIATEIIKGRL